MTTVSGSFLGLCLVGALPNPPSDQMGPFLLPVLRVYSRGFSMRYAWCWADTSLSDEGCVCRTGLPVRIDEIKLASGKIDVRHAKPSTHW